MLIKYIIINYMTKYDNWQIMRNLCFINNTGTPETTVPLPSYDEMRSFARFCSLDSGIADDILNDYHALSADRELTEYYNLIRSVMFSGQKFIDVDSRLNFELAPEKITRIAKPGRFQLLCALSAYGHAEENFKKAAFPFSAFKEGAVDLAVHARQYRDNFDENGLSWNSLCWWGNLVRGTVIRQGRLEFNTSMSFFENLSAWQNKNDASVEVRKDDLPIGKEWENILKKGDPVIYIHIPAGEPLRLEDSAASLRRIIDFFREHIPSYPYKAIVSTSWLLDTQFQSILSPDSNLVKIPKLLRIHPSTLEGCDTIERVFGVNGVRNGIDSVPLRTGMQKAFAEFLKSGGTFRSGVMFLFPEETEKYLTAFSNTNQIRSECNHVGQ